MANGVAATSGGRDPTGPVKVMVVDDSAVVRGLISRWLSELPGIRVVSGQHNGKAAVEAMSRVDPDVVILDIEMPEMDGLTALPLLLKKKPSLAVIMASTLTRRNAEVSLRAMALGARDYIAKPDGSQGLAAQHTFRRELGEKVAGLGRASRAAHVDPDPAPARPEAAIALWPASRTRPRVLAIGSSTGGPPALLQVIQALGAAIDNVPILIAQHMPPTFTAIMAEQLGRTAGRPAKEAAQGDLLRPGHIYVAPGNCHLYVDHPQAPTACLDDGPPVNYCRPAVDPLFESVARIYGPAALALVLTGMGSDGTVGANAIADQGGTVIAQDEASSVVWGMPGSAARSGACAAVLPLSELGERLASIIGGRRP